MTVQISVSHLNHAFNVESACNVAMKIIVQLILQTSKYSTYVGSTLNNAYVSYLVSSTWLSKSHSQSSDKKHGHTILFETSEC